MERFCYEVNFRFVAEIEAVFYLRYCTYLVLYYSIEKMNNFI